MTEFSLSSDVAALFDVSHDYERNELAHFSSRIKTARRFIDVGANKGLYSYVADSLLSDAEIVLVEANPELCTHMRTNLGLFCNTRGNKIAIHNFGASDEDGQMQFALGESDTLGTFTLKNDLDGRRRTISVSTRRLDSVITAMPDTVFKIDVEGLEWRVLQGGISIMREAGCTIFVEVHGWGDASIRKYPFHVLALMFRNGFGVERVGSGFQYIFQRTYFRRRLSTFLRCAPLLLIKCLARRVGIRPFFYRLKAIFG